MARAQEQSSLLSKKQKTIKNKKTTINNTMGCDLCGSEGSLVRAEVEGSTLTVCKNCASYGKIIGPVRSQQEQVKSRKKIAAPSKPEKEIMELLASDFALVIKRKREQLGLNQAEFAKKLNEKESIIQKIESGHFEPSLTTARKYERLLHIKLVENYEESFDAPKKGKSESFTIGDIIKIKKK